MAEERKILPHLKAKRELIERISELVRPDGSLPPERELSETLEVSRPTLRKALNALIAESFLKKTPRQGYFPTGAKPKFHIAIASHGWAVPYPEVLEGALGALSKENFWVGVMTLRDEAEARRACESYGLSGILWLDSFEKVERFDLMLRKSGIPMTGALPFAEKSKGKPLFAKAVASFDSDEAGRLRAEAMLSLGKRRIAYVGSSAKNNCYARFKDALAKAGVEHDPALLLDETEETSRKLAGLLRSKSVDAVVSDGKPSALEAVFETLAGSPYGRTLPLEAPGAQGLDDLRARFPEVRVAFVMDIPFKEVGAKAARMLLRFIAGDKRRESVSLPPTLRAVAKGGGL